MKAVVKLRVLAAAGAVAAVAACSPVGAAGHRPGLTVFWTRQRLIDARPFYGQRQRPLPVPGQSPDAHTALLGLRVGALFFQNGGDDHFCTASVVSSPGRNLLITAAHCINNGDGQGYRKDIVFVPDYRGGQAPFGIWAAKRLLVAPQWAQSSDPDLDVGFVTLEPHDGRNIEDILGADRLGVDRTYRYLVRVTGYPNSADVPITCLNWTSGQTATQLRFACGGYTDGTSGSPWVTHFDRRTRAGTIVGVIGGYEQGGDNPAISYSSYFGPAVQHLYQQAAAQDS